MKNRWFVATIIVKCRVGDEPQADYSCDEQIVLLKAPDEDAAYKKALKLGEEQETHYLNDEGETVYWEFLGLENLEELEEERITDGVEIRSRLRRLPKPEDLVRKKERMAVFLTTTYKQKELAQVG
jgi:hypothetical protein